MKKTKNIGAGNRIKYWRKKVGIKAQKLAELIKLSQGSLSEIENGISNPSAVTILNLILYTDINIIWVLTGIKDYENGTETEDYIKDSIVNVDISAGQELRIKVKDQ